MSFHENSRKTFLKFPPLAEVRRDRARVLPVPLLLHVHALRLHDVGSAQGTPGLPSEGRKGLIVAFSGAEAIFTF